MPGSNAVPKYWIDLVEEARGALDEVFEDCLNTGIDEPMWLKENACTACLPEEGTDCKIWVGIAGDVYYSDHIEDGVSPDRSGCRQAMVGHIIAPDILQPAALFLRYVPVRIEVDTPPEENSSPVCAEPRPRVGQEARDADNPS